MVYNLHTPLMQLRDKPLVTTIECRVREMHLIDLLNSSTGTTANEPVYLLKATGRIEPSANVKQVRFKLC